MKNLALSEPPDEKTAPSDVDLGVEGLTAEESNFVYNVEVLGLPNTKAAKMAGMPITKQCAPHIMQARQAVRAQVRADMGITKEDVVYGIRDAIGRARILAEPMTEIVGWEKIGKLMGFDESNKVDINITTSIQVLKEHVRGIPDAELVKRLGAGSVIDVDFYEVPSDGQEKK